MPRLTNLDDDILRGIIFGFNLLNHDAPTAHSKLLQLTGTEIFTLKQVEDLYQQIKKCQYKLGSTNQILLAENGVICDHGIKELVQQMRCKMLKPNEAFEIVLLDIARKDLYELRTINAMYFDDKSVYNKNALRGLMLCLKSQGAELAEATKGEAWKQLQKPVLSVADLQELNEEIERGEYLEQQHSVRLWAATKPYKVMKSIVKHADFDSRIALQQTCVDFQLLVNREPIHFENLFVEFSKTYMKIQADSVISKIFRRVPPLPGCFIVSHGKVWYDKTKNFGVEAAKFLKWLSCRERLTVTNLRMQSPRRAYLDGICRMNVKNLYIHTLDLRNMEQFLQICQPEHLKSIYSFVPLETRRPLQLTGNLQNIEVLAIYPEFRNFHDLHHLKFAVFPIEESKFVERCMEFKDNLLQNLTFREFILRGVSGEIHDELNTWLGLNNEYRTKHVEWARFYYPEPNQDKYILAASANWVMRFRGPGYISEDEEKFVCNELLTMDTMGERFLEEVDWKRDGLIEKEIEELKARNEEAQEEFFSK